MKLPIQHKGCLGVALFGFYQPLDITRAFLWFIKGLLHHTGLPVTKGYLRVVNINEVIKQIKAVASRTKTRSNQ